MPLKRTLAVVVFAGVLAGTFAASKPTDLDVLAKVARTGREKIQNTLPEARAMAAPLVAFRAGDALPVEERVRVRIQTDKAMAGAEVTVLPTPTAGEVRLKGIVGTSAQKARAIELATGTAGVETVKDEMAVPEGR